VSCPLCTQRKARRACPALQQQICAVCCATKRLTEIACPPDCAYLASAREHPPAAAVRQQHRDAALVMRLVQDFNQRQSELLFVVARALISYEPPPFQSLNDADIAEAVSALAATSETAGRGVIYEHRAASGPGAHLASALRALLTEAGAYRDSAIERDLASALRRLEAILVETRTAESAQGAAVFLTFLRRILASPDATERPSSDADRAPRLIVS
jgi:hypothetical protein